MDLSSLDILLVEDNAYDRELTLRALQRSHVANRVITVDDGAEALDFLFRQGRFSERDGTEMPSVIFLDLKLPKVDGIEVLRRIKSDDRTRKIPVVIITSSAEDRDRIDSYELGVNSYVVKPIEFENFSKTVSDLGFYWLAINKPPL